MWFRSDLRMHDNAALAAADKEGSSLLAVRLPYSPHCLCCTHTGQRCNSILSCSHNMSAGCFTYRILAFDTP